MNKIIVILFLACSLVFISGFESKSIKSDSNLLKLVELNLQIHNSFDYGVGLPGYPTMAQTIEYGNGHCGLYVTYLAEEFKKKGYKAVVWDLHSGLSSSEQFLYHSVIETVIDNKIYTFDPTLGIYYENSVSELITNASISKNAVGTIKNEKLKIYANPYFWANVKKTQIQTTLNYAKDNIITKVPYTVRGKDNFYSSPNDLEASLNLIGAEYTASKEGILPVEFTITFSKEVNVNRLYFEWFDLDNYPTEFSIYDNKNSKLISTYKDYVNEVGYENTWLNSSVKTNSLTFKFSKFKGQQRLLLRNLHLY
ncbi:hypothetical protein POF51_13155 [Brevibacillus sp. AG]|uniref:hypothetical protein n=1 Tax=Brevibacillus sp. AG TaxID=3020891 RepID=UPI000853E449|nr:hypothetical protein [Brevibacillus sp. AG]MDC0761647.1 hypothetical protein [Brevibacillus sp. AG]